MEQRTRAKRKVIIYFNLSVSRLAGNSCPANWRKEKWRKSWSELPGRACLSASTMAIPTLLNPIDAGKTRAPVAHLKTAATGDQGSKSETQAYLAAIGVPITVPITSP